MKRQPLFTLLLFVTMFSLSFSGSAQQVTLSGSAQGAEGKSIRVTAWSDLITFTESRMADIPIDTMGNFAITFDLSETMLITLSIDLHKSTLYMEPGKSYYINLAPINYTDNQEINPFIQSQNLQVRLLNQGQSELNNMIWAYDGQYNQFLLKHFNALYLERKKNYLDTFRLQVNNQFNVIGYPYFENYIIYKTAGLEQIARAMSQNNLAKKYFIDTPILYQNTEYMQFFNNFFTKYLTASSDILRKIDFTPIIKGVDPYPKLMKSLATDSVLQHRELRELVLLKGLYELYYTNKDLQDPIITLFDTISRQSSTEANRLIALNMKNKVTKLRPGTPAPPFTLIGRTTDQTLSLKDFLGKPVVLNFWTTYCEGCLAEMELEVSLYEKYKDQVEFVSICIDKYWVKMKYFALVKPELAWTLLHFAGDTDLLVDYEVRSYPLYVVIDREGNIVQAPAPNPSEGLEKVIEELIH